MSHRSLWFVLGALCTPLAGQEDLSAGDLDGTAADFDHEQYVVRHHAARRISRAIATGGDRTGD